MIAVVDAQTGNLRSVEKALRTALAAAGSHETLVVTADAEVVRRADRVVVPGQGAFGDCGRTLSRRAPLGSAIVAAIEAGTPYLGICLGLQVLFEESEEAPGTPGLGVLAGRVVRIPDGLPDGHGGRLKVPHMGWNEVAPRGRPHPLLAAVNAALHNAPATPLPYYFVHSYHAVPEESFLVEGTCSYGDLTLAAAVAARNLFAVQFHPEKSQHAGLALLGAFVTGGRDAMRIYPAIDLLGGKAVRLREGRREQATVYSDRPREVAERYAAAGATRIHVVDLDGAFAGRRENVDAVAGIVAAAAAGGATVQLGGGVRDLATCEALLGAGVERVVLGTAMVKSREVVEQACRRFPGRIVVAVDARDGRVAIEGWAEATALSATELAEAAAAAGCAAVLYTDIARDGTGRGPNVTATVALASRLGLVEVIASGGIASLDDLRGLAAGGVPAAVVGRALYEGAFTLAEAMAAAARATAAEVP